MRYIDKSLGFSFELPESWRHDEHNLTLTFFGPNGRIGHALELIQMQIGTIQQPYMEPEKREKFLAELGAVVFRGKLGRETNVVVLEKPGDTEISAVHDGVHYTIAHSNDETTKLAAEKLKTTFSFPSAEEASDAIQRFNNPQKQAILKALKYGCAEEARRVLKEAEAPSGLKCLADPGSIRKKAKRAGDLWKEGDYCGARLLYEDIIASISLPLDKAKTLSNIAQLYAKEGDINGAIDNAHAAIKVVNENELFKSMAGSHLRGYLNGFVNRLEGKGRWETVPFNESIPLDLNLSIFSRLRVHFSVAVISGVLLATLNTEMRMPNLNISLNHGKIVIFSFAGVMFSIFFASILLRQTVCAVIALTGQNAEKSLGPAVNLLTFFAALYLLFLPNAIWSMASEVVVFVLTAVFGAVVFYGIMFRKHAKKIE